jgi:hypothetical protein
MGGLGAGMLADAIGDQGAMAVFGAIPTFALAALLALGRRELRRL